MKATLFLRQNDDTGTWLYTLPGANRMNTTVEKKGIDYGTLVGQRVGQSDAYKEQATYEYHYIILSDVDVDLTQEEVNELGFEDQVEMDVMTGVVDW